MDWVHQMQLMELTVIFILILCHQICMAQRKKENGRYQEV
jgi:hypothetical protein